MTRSRARPIDVLLVEDNPGDVRLTREAFAAGGVRHTLHVTRDGAAAVDFLHRIAPFADAAQPDLILLDLNLPKKDGREVLQVIKQDDALQHIPVVILTTSQAERDVLETYRLRANAYVTKPVVLEEFLRVIASIQDFWLDIVRLP
ncbi:MAG TPA: response regulator [Gemmatimonadales bacterium]|nr:response regulator [Gemmatimonadales bacterium]